MLKIFVILTGFLSVLAGQPEVHPLWALRCRRPKCFQAGWSYDFVRTECGEECEWKPEVNVFLSFFNNYKIAPTKIWFVSKRFCSWQYLCGQGSQDNRSVTLVRFEDWFEEIPGNISEMMSLISFVDSRREVDDNSSPIIIQCMWVPTLCWWCYRSVQGQLFLWMKTQTTLVYTTTCPPSWLVRWRECQMAKRL